MRVLVVEDDTRLARTVKQGLEEASLAVDIVHDGGEAVEMARMAAYDVIVLDLMLPGLDGIEVSRRLRAHHVAASILMLTARDTLDDKIVGFEAGADDYLVKPFALRELVARIRALGRRLAPDRGSRLRRGDIELDTGARRLLVVGKPVELSAREYAILEYFVLNAGLLLTRDQITDHVWSHELEGGRNLIEVYVSRLRHKITEAGGADPFVTVRGSGYRLEAPAGEP